MGRKRQQPLLKGFSVGDREVCNGMLLCKQCGQWKNSEKFNTHRRQYTALCKVCDSDRVAYINMIRRIEEKGIAKEIESVQEMERQLEQRKNRLLKYVEEYKPKEL